MIEYVLYGVRAVGTDSVQAYVANLDGHIKATSVTKDNRLAEINLALMSEVMVQPLDATYLLQNVTTIECKDAQNVKFTLLMLSPSGMRAAVPTMDIQAYEKKMAELIPGVVDFHSNVCIISLLRAKFVTAPKNHKKAIAGGLALISVLLAAGGFLYKYLQSQKTQKGVGSSETTTSKVLPAEKQKKPSKLNVSERKTNPRQLIPRRNNFTNPNTD